MKALPVFSTNFLIKTPRDSSSMSIASLPSKLLPIVHHSLSKYTKISMKKSVGIFLRRNLSNVRECEEASRVGQLFILKFPNEDQLRPLIKDISHDYRKVQQKGI